MNVSFRFYPCPVRVNFCRDKKDAANTYIYRSRGQELMDRATTIGSRPPVNFHFSRSFERSVRKGNGIECQHLSLSLSLSLAQFPSLPPPPLVDSILLVPPLAESRAHEAGSIRSLKCIPTRTTYYAHHKGVFALSMTELIETARYDPFRVYIPLLAADGMFARCRRVGWILPAS